MKQKRYLFTIILKNVTHTVCYGCNNHAESPMGVIDSRLDSIMYLRLSEYIIILLLLNNLGKYTLGKMDLPETWSLKDAFSR